MIHCYQHVKVDETLTSSQKKGQAQISKRVQEHEKSGKIDKGSHH